jgi:hypothetical protein
MTLDNLEPDAACESGEDAAVESFYSGALTRISRYMLVLAIIFEAAVLLRFGWRIALGFAAGCVIAYLNFHWLKRAVTVLAERITRTGSGRGRVVWKFLLRYILAGIVAYVLFRLTPIALKGFLAGLFLPVAAILCEAAYEAYAAVFHAM